MRQADVTSIEALTAFRGHFIKFLSEAGLALDQASEDITRTRVWLQNDQRLHWEREVRRSRAEQDQARQQLQSARLLADIRSKDFAERAYRRAVQACQHAEAKLVCVRHEARRYNSVVEPKLKELDALRQILTDTGPRATAFLAGVVEALQDYAETAPPRPEPPAAPPDAPGGGS